VCISGSVTVLVDDCKVRKEYILNSPNIGLYVPNNVWCSQRSFSKDCKLLVFASELYDPKDYIRDYEVFVSMNEGSS
jgi:dTDP-4-dehydrorhamnose 3,5-epimerase-like enzyme